MLAWLLALVVVLVLPAPAAALDCQRALRCYLVVRKDDTWELHNPDRFTRIILRRAQAADD